MNQMEIQELRTYNSKCFATRNTKKRSIFLGSFRREEVFGELKREFHVKPIHYVRQNNTWGELGEIASYFGNKNGMLLKQGWEEKADFGYLGWYLKRNKLIKGKGIRIGIEQGSGIKRLELPLVLNTEGTFYPDPDPETTSVDGDVRRQSVTESWATIIAGAGNAKGDASASAQSVLIAAGGTTDIWTQNNRGIFLYDTSALGAGATVSAAIKSLFGAGKTDNGSFVPDINIYASTPASNTALENADYGQTGSTPFSTAISYANYSTIAYNDFELNEDGIAAISVTGVSKFSAKNANYDVAESPPTWVIDKLAFLTNYFADQADLTNDPKFAVTYEGGASVITRRTIHGIIR